MSSNKKKYGIKVIAAKEYTGNFNIIEVKNSIISDKKIGEILKQKREQQNKEQNKELQKEKNKVIKQNDKLQNIFENNEIIKNISIYITGVKRRRDVNLNLREYNIEIIRRDKYKISKNKRYLTGNVEYKSCISLKINNKLNKTELNKFEQNIIKELQKSNEKNK